MDRREFMVSSVAGVAGAKLNRAMATGQEVGFKPGSEGAEELFPAQSLPELAWTQFTASGFSKPVCGTIHRKSKPAECGMPLGVVGTGCLDLDTDGTFGYCSIFNSFVPPSGPLRQPFLGIVVGKQAWVLATRYTAEIEGVKTPDEIHYWGHYPVADLEYETSAPVSVGLRAWTPFIPGDVAMSNTPGAVFEVRLRNKSRSRQQGTLKFSFPGPSQAEAQISPESPRARVHLSEISTLVPVAQGVTPARRQALQGDWSGVSVTSDAGVGYTLAVPGSEKVLVGSACSPLGGIWSRAGGGILEPHEDDFGTAAAVEFDLGPREAKTIRFVLAWYAPLWKGRDKNCFTCMYATRYPNSQAVAQLLARDHRVLLERILNWQQAIYTADRLPVWLRETLVNNLHLMTKTGLWAAAKPSIGDWARPEDGLFGMMESPREAPQMECIPCSFYGNIPLVYFFPELALSTLRGYKAYQYPDGAAPWLWSKGCAGVEMATPVRGYQTTSNGISYAAMVDRYWLRTGRDEVLQEFYASVKQNTIYTMNLNTGPDGVISMPTGNIDPANGEAASEWVEGEPWFGMSPHVGGLHLAQLKISERMAEKMGDKEFAERCRQWFKSGSDSLEDKLWAGESYLVYYEPETGKRSERVFSCQLDGDWIDLFQGLPPVFRRDRAKTALATIRRTNSPLSPYGTVLLANRDGTPSERGERGYGPYAYFVSEQLMLAMTYMYAGEMDFGLEQARRCLANLMAKGYTWDQPCIIQATTGERTSGYDYSQNMMLWALPAAVEGTDMRRQCAPGAFIDRIIQAGRKS